MTAPGILDALGDPRAVATLVVLVVAGGLLLAAVTRGQSRWMRWAALAAVVCSALVLCARLVAGASLIDDEVTWHHLGVQAAEQLVGVVDTDLAYVDGKEGYLWLLGAVYAVAGPAPLVPIVLNMLAHALLVVVVARVAVQVAEELPRLDEAARTLGVRIAAWTTATLPTIVFWVPRELRETVTLLVVATAVLGVVLAIRRRTPVPLVLTAIAVVALWPIRQTTATAVLAAAVAAVLVGWALHRRRPSLHLAFILPTVALLCVVAWQFADGAVGLSPDEIAFRNRDLATAGSAFAGAAVEGGDSLLDILAIGVPRVLAGPFPWELSLTPVMLLAAAEGMAWVAVVALTVLLVATGGGARSAVVVALVIVAAALVGALTISVANYGLLARARLLPLVVLLPLAGLAVGLVLQRRRAMRAQRAWRRHPIAEREQT